MTAPITAHTRSAALPEPAMQPPGAGTLPDIGPAVAAEPPACEAAGLPELSLEFWYFCGDGRDFLPI